MSFGSYLKGLRTALDFTQSDVAAAADMKAQYLNKIENNKVAPPSEEILIRLAAALKEDPYMMIVKAEKIPTDFKDIILHDEDAFVYLRNKLK
ncbi:helix-turn-helix domain-containing protein [Paenibacillus alvei]|uniref:Helix-turn-helix domain-containing protein n=1 Tax=Paenibacillus alvei TaxID=44250 RepID=A0ABT4H3L8_PAEAL|nr:helix-turn-helix transcriptional regulator [Paenibacillus alvei]MCY9763239.1 helix-turn-helix domain-containing protein [Paenibacillus alvei]MCY9769472.1 helix-turn-helix domain-containing protein [Paenibacillus alvei]